MNAIHLTRCPTCNELRNEVLPCPFCSAAEYEHEQKMERVYLVAGTVFLLSLTALVLVVMVQL